MSGHYRIWIVALSFAPVVLFLVALTIQALLNRVCAASETNAPEQRSYLTDEVALARRSGSMAAFRVEPRSTCPYSETTALPLYLEWYTGYTLWEQRERNGIRGLQVVRSNGRTNGQTERTDADASTDRRGTAGLKSSGRREDKA